jgi:tRNA threonylcarbamoyladenosine biosynthesis protein TsaB
LIVLSVDTSTPVGSVALTKKEEVLAEYILRVAHTHARHVLVLIERMLADCGVSFETLDALAVTVGPGSFTGLRIGMATVKGLAYAAKKPVLGVSTLLALAQNLAFAPYPICPLLDAKKKEVYCGIYRDPGDGTPRTEWEDRAIAPHKLISRISEKTLFLGDGTLLYRDLLAKTLGAKALFAPESLHFPRASNVGRLAYYRLREGKVDHLFTLTPRYLRRSEAETARDERERFVD